LYRRPNPVPDPNKPYKFDNVGVPSTVPAFFLMVDRTTNEVIQDSDSYKTYFDKVVRKNPP
jgi:hypothetical protein